MPFFLGSILSTILIIVFQLGLLALATIIIKKIWNKF